MGNAQLWVWMGSPDDKLDVLRYVKATNQDILGQPVVQAEIAALRDALEGMCRAHCIYTTRGLFPGNEVEEEAFRLLGWEKPHPATPIGPTGPTGPAG